MPYLCLHIPEVRTSLYHPCVCVCLLLKYIVSLAFNFVQKLFCCIWSFQTSNLIPHGSSRSTIFYIPLHQSHRNHSCSLNRGMRYKALWPGIKLSSTERVQRELWGITEVGIVERTYRLLSPRKQRNVRNKPRKGALKVLELRPQGGNTAQLMQVWRRPPRWLPVVR